MSLWLKGVLGVLSNKTQSLEKIIPLFKVRSRHINALGNVVLQISIFLNVGNLFLDDRRN